MYEPSLTGCLRWQGLFDPPAETGGLATLGAEDVGTNASAELNLRATAESLVLLKNEKQTLPLKPGGKIAIVGPHANASRFLIQVDTGKICGGDGTFNCVESPYQAVKRLNVGGSTTMAVGCDLIDDHPNVSTPALKAAAVAAAQAADTVILAIGIGQCGCMGISDTYVAEYRAKHGLGAASKCGASVVPPYDTWDNCWNHAETSAGQYVGAEAHDKILIDLPPVQRDLAKAILGNFISNPTVACDF